MRKAMFWFGWTVMILIPIAWLAQIAIMQDLPKIELWQWSLPVAAFALIVLGRNHDDVLKHHLI